MKSLQNKFKIKQGVCCNKTVTPKHVKVSVRPHCLLGKSFISSSSPTTWGRGGLGFCSGFRKFEMRIPCGIIVIIIVIFLQPDIKSCFCQLIFFS